jgi:hypothetical protein
MGKKKKRSVIIFCENNFKNARKDESIFTGKITMENTEEYIVFVRNKRKKGSVLEYKCVFLC